MCQPLRLDIFGLAASLCLGRPEPIGRRTCCGEQITPTTSRTFLIVLRLAVAALTMTFLLVSPL